MTAHVLALVAPLTDGEARTHRRKAQKPMDEARFEAFYRRTAGGLWSYIFRLTGDASVADDLLQKACFQLLRANPVLESDEHMRHYMFRVATNVALDHLREVKRERGRAIELPRTDGRGDRDDLRRDMMRIFTELKPRDRALLWLAHVEESDHEEIGAALGVRPKSVRVLLFRARKKLAELLATKGFGPEVLR